MSPYLGIVILLAIAAGFITITIVTSLLVGPSRYNLAGAFVLFRGRAYNASVSYLPAPGLAR